MGNANQALLYGVGHFAAARDFNAHGVGKQLANALFHGIVDGCGEKHGLVFFGQVAGNAVNVGRKAHVKHAVCFVKHKEAHARQVNKALVFQVNQAARRGNKNVNACFQLLDLRVLGNAAHNGQNAMVR